MAGHRRAEATPSFERLCPAMTAERAAPIAECGVLVTLYEKTRPVECKAVIPAAQRRLFRRLRQAGLCLARTGDALARDHRARIVGPLRASENAVAAARGGPADRTGNPGAAGRGPDGARDPARLRRDPRTGQSLLRLERGRPAGAAARAAVATAAASPLAC